MSNPVLSVYEARAAEGTVIPIHNAGSHDLFVEMARLFATSLISIALPGILLGGLVLLNPHFFAHPQKLKQAGILYLILVSAVFAYMTKNNVRFSIKKKSAV